MEQQPPKKHCFIFMPGEDQGVAPVLAPGQLGKVKAQRVGHNQQIFHKDHFCVSLLILHSATSRAATE